ncbi:unnamed protein product, partial [Timema podura]|nr:unnamed protein product [Timema podura]
MVKAGSPSLSGVPRGPKSLHLRLTPPLGLCSCRAILSA